jgi:hypothetical protein
MSLTLPYQCAAATGLLPEHRIVVRNLLESWQEHISSNRRRQAYYLMHNAPATLGITVTDEVSRNLNSACGWGKKVVDVMVEHSSFDGFTTDDDAADAVLSGVYRRNRMRTMYKKAATSALTYGFNTYIVTDDGHGRAKVTARDAHTSTGLWNEAEGKLSAGLFVVSMRRDRLGRPTSEPDWVDVLTDEYVIKLKSPAEGEWRAEYEPHGLGWCPMFVSAYEPTLERPFGCSRITREVMGYIDEAVRLNVDEAVAAAFAASPQRYLLGTDSDTFQDASKYAHYIGAIFNVDMTSEGTVPQYGSLPQPSMQPLTDHFRNLCGRMAAATGVHISQFGLVHDQPASSDAIYMENEPLILKCRDWNDVAGDALVDVATACLATETGMAFADVRDLDYNIEARFPNPAQPTLAQMTDAAVKIASVKDGFAQTETFDEMLGFNSEERRRIRRELSEAQAANVLDSFLAAVPEQTVPTGEDEVLATGPEE